MNCLSLHTVHPSDSKSCVGGQSAVSIRSERASETSSFSCGIVFSSFLYMIDFVFQILILYYIYIASEFMKSPREPCVIISVLFFAIGDPSTCQRILRFSFPFSSSSCSHHLLINFHTPLPSSSIIKPNHNKANFSHDMTAHSLIQPAVLCFAELNGRFAIEL